MKNGRIEPIVEMKRLGQLFFIASYPDAHAARVVSAVEHSLRALEGEPSDLLPVHWNFAAYPFLADGSVRVGKLIDRMLERTADMILPMGYSGAYQHLLFREELDRELAWVGTNPFGSGFATVLGIQPEVYFPHAADFLRTSSIAAWREHTPVLLADSKRGEMLLRRDGRDATFPLLWIEPGWERRSWLSNSRLSISSSVASLLRQLRHFTAISLHSAGFVVGDMTAMEPDQITALFGALFRLQRAHGAGLFARLREYLPHLEPKAAVPREPSGGDVAARPFDLLAAAGLIPTDPAARMVRREVESSRSFGAPARRRPVSRSAEDREVRRRLERLAPVDPLEVALSHTAPPHRRDQERTLIADMLGEVLLDEGDFAVRFSSGRLTGLSRGGRELLANLPSRSYLAVGRREIPFSVVNAFSIEGEHVRGLRVSCQATDPEFVHPGAITQDFLLVQDFRQLVVSLTVRYPELQPQLYVDACAAMEIPLFRLEEGDEIAVEAGYPDGEEYRLRIAPTAGTLALPGSRFRITRGEASFLLALPDGESSTIDVLPLVITLEERGHLLSVSPRGFYGRTAANRLAGIEEHFTLFLDADLRGQLPIPSLEANPGNEVRPSWIRRSASS